MKHLQELAALFKPASNSKEYTSLMEGKTSYEDRVNMLFATLLTNENINDVVKENLKVLHEEYLNSIAVALRIK